MKNLFAVDITCPLSQLPAQKTLPNTDLACDMVFADKCCRVIFGSRVARKESLAMDSARGMIVVIDGDPVSEDGRPLSAPDILAAIQRGEETFVNLHGAFNVLVAKSLERRVELHNDHFGSLPCYYYQGPNRLFLSNSVQALRKSLGFEVDLQALAQQFSLGYVVGDATLFRNIKRIKPGGVHLFSLNDPGRSTFIRKSDAWSRAENGPLRRLVEESHHKWETTVGRLARAQEGPLGLMLSGGLDSRMVLGGLSQTNAALVCCTHGDPLSKEVRIASEVSSVNGAPWICNRMDGGFAFSDLHLASVFNETELLFNPIWWKSGLMLQDRGVSAVATGCLGDAILGGSYVFQFENRRARLFRNVANSFGFVIPQSGTLQEQVRTCAHRISHEADKRFRNYSRLLRGHLREAFRNEVPGICSHVQDIMEGYVKEGATSGWQVQERFLCEHRDRKLVFGQELTARAFGRLVLPTLDAGFAPWVTNLDPKAKYDHRLYYPLFRRLYPELSRVEVPNLHGGIECSQLWIESRRALNQALTKAKHRGRPWCNFDWWLRATGNISAYERVFLSIPEVFDAREVEVHFDHVRSGTRSLYDGNETLGFIALAWHFTGGPVWEQ